MWDSGCVDPRVFGLGTSWRSVVSVTVRLLFTRRRNLQYLLHCCMGPKTGLHDAENRRISTTPRDQNPTPRSSSHPGSNIEFERFRRWPNRSMYFPGICLDELSKTTNYHNQKVTSAPEDCWNEHLPNNPISLPTVFMLLPLKFTAISWIRNQL
jgi:hypothetical protein